MQEPHTCTRPVDRSATLFSLDSVPAAPPGTAPSLRREESQSSPRKAGERQPRPPPPSVAPPPQSSGSSTGFLEATSTILSKHLQLRQQTPYTDLLQLSNLRWSQYKGSKFHHKVQAVRSKLFKLKLMNNDWTESQKKMTNKMKGWS